MVPKKAKSKVSLVATKVGPPGLGAKLIRYAFGAGLFARQDNYQAGMEDQGYKVR